MGHEAWCMAQVSMPIHSLLETAIKEPSIGETSRFRWHATPVGIAAVWLQQDSPMTPPFDDALQEALEVGLDLSREEREFHQISDGLVLLFHS